jgi:hypothetical protein
MFIVHFYDYEVCVVQQIPIDIRDVQGLRTDSEHNGRAEYAPFPGGFSISPG